MSHPYHGLNELREMFLKFFETKGHLRLPSFSLVPQNDKSILLINAGMTPMKPWFKGEEEPPLNHGFMGVMPALMSRMDLSFCGTREKLGSRR